jgi:uncharacterized membrane protein YebE (DUF533 family)
MANIDAIKILGGLLNSGALSRGSGSNALGSVIGAITGGGQSGGGGLGSLIGGMLGGGQSNGGGMGDLLGGLLGGGARSAGGASPSSGGGLGDLFGMAMNQFGAARQGNAQLAREVARNSQPSDLDYGRAEQQAELLIRAMINAAKADGRVDSEEQQRIVERLGEVTRDELEFVQRELAATLDVDGFVRSVPRGMEQQVYAVSLMAIDLDSNPEAQYLHQLAQGVGMSAETCNQIHQQLGAPQLYG